uniref:Ig-like domain-containing protein n=1 Tax=Peromyscus maniculatus bairdii TaxID=230844 RepID=A0A8C8U5V7_PERMB
NIWLRDFIIRPIKICGVFSGSWTQNTELLPTVEGNTVLVRCQYDPSQRFKEKAWCQETREKNCKLLVSSLSTDAQQSKFSIWDYPDYQFFTVTMTALTVRDSGPYFCGVAENRRTIFILRNIYLKVSKGSPYPASLFSWSVDSSLRPWSSLSYLLSHRGHLGDRP